MKKSKKISIYILLIISIFIFNGQHVYADGTQCGFRYFPSYHGYAMFYLHGDYCSPYSKVLAEARGIYKNNGWNTIAAEISCDSSDCEYMFLGEKVKSVDDCGTGDYQIWEATKDNKTKTEKTIYIKGQSRYNCIKAWYDSYTYNSDYVYHDTKGGAFCLKQKKGDHNIIVSKKGYKYNNGENGYAAVEFNKYCNSQPDDSDKTDNTDNNNPASCPSDNLYSGCTGSNVQNLQTKLKVVQGCDIEIDGKYGSKTKECVIEFQKSNNIDGNGVAGSETISALDEAYVKLQQGSSNTNELYYYITFDTNGGIFLNGETKRNVYYSESELTMEPATIPGKSGYKFLGWYSGNEKYTFGNKLTSNITLTAKYEKSTTTKYCLDGDVLDEANNQCITVQDFADQDKNKFYIINNRLLTIQTKFIYTRNCSSDNKYTVTYEKAEGSNNSISCDTEKGYARDTWRAEDTCQSDKTCPIKDGNNSCQRVYRGTCYKTYYPGDTALGTKPDSDNTYNKDINNNATESPQTGGGIIALIIVTLSIIGLSIFCYKVYNNKKEEV